MCYIADSRRLVFFCQAEDGIRDYKVTGVQTCALPIFSDELVLVTARRQLREMARPYRARTRRSVPGSAARAGSSVIGASSFRDGCVRGEDGSHGGFVALEVDEPNGVVKGEHTRRQSKNDRRVSAHDGVEIAAIVRVHLDARAR